MDGSQGSVVDYCTLWFEGSWPHCCKAHDLAYLSDTPRLYADWDLLVCVVSTGNPVMGLVMGAVVMLLGGFFRKPMKVDLRLGHTGSIIKACKKHGLLRNQAAYVLATAYWETGRTMKPVKEAYWLSENWRKKNLRYYPWYGRGYVQLTWETNYRRATRELGADFVTNKDLALDPDLGAEILVVGSRDGWFTGGKHYLSKYITLKKSDFTNARRIINIMDKASTIAGIAKKYNVALKRAGYGESKSITVADTTPTSDKVPPKKAPKKVSLNVLRLLFDLLKRLFSK